jgi:ATP-dependent helicase/DNAse subunit B
LDPLTRGSELHAVYAAVLRRVLAENRGLRKSDANWLMAFTRERLNQLHEEMPAPTAEILEREVRDFLSDVELFFNEELERTSSTPVGLEVSFGRLLDDEDDPLAREAPAEIPLGDGLTLKIAGRIDRIDQVGDASFEVIDYKTGGFWRDDWKGVFAGGTRLQHALYGLAATELLKARRRKSKVTAGVYYFSSHKGRLERVSIPAPSASEINSVLRDLRQVIVDGQFTRTSDEKNCRYCDYAAACGGEVNEQAARKLADPRVPAFERLTKHE